MKAQYFDLAQKTVLITGATRGIGRAVALAFAEQKSHVVFNYRQRNDHVETLLEEIKAKGGRGSALAFDLNHHETMIKEIDQFLQNGHTLDCLVNNAGISKDQLALRIKPQDIDEVLNTNLKSTMILTHHVLKNLIKKPGSTIIHMSSIVGLMGNVAQALYATSKAGLIGHAKSLAKEYGSRQLRVNVICPGFIQTEMTDKLTAEAKEHYLKSVPLNHFGQAQEVAELACFLASDASSYITGEVIKIDGGLYI